MAEKNEGSTGQPPGSLGKKTSDPGQCLWDDLMRRLMFSGATARASDLSKDDI